MRKGETGPLELCRQDPAALQYQFRFGTDEWGAKFEEPCWRGQAERMIHFPAQGRHKPGVCNRVRCAYIVGAFEVGMIEEPFDRAADIVDVYPTAHLFAASLPAPQAPFDKALVRHHCPSFSQGDCGPKRNFSGERCPLAEE